MKKFTAILFVLTLLLSSCGTPEEDESSELEKKDFYIETRNYLEFSSGSILLKSARLSTSQDINISSNAVGRVGIVYVKEGDRVYKGQPMAALEDNIGSYGISLSRASNGVERSRISYDSTKLSLDKAVNDSELSVKQLEFNLESLIKEKEESLKTAKLDLENADYTSLDSKSALELEKLDNTILKLELDYETTLINNVEAIEGFKATMKKDYNALLTLQSDVIELGDKLFGITDKYKNDAKKIKNYFGGRNATEKNQTKNYLLDLISFSNGEFSNFTIDSLSEEEIINATDIMLDGFDQTKTFLNSLESTLNNSITSVGTFSDTDIAGYLASVNGYQSTSQISYATFIGFSSSTKSFLRTYLNNENSLNRQIELLKKDREILVKSLNTGGVGAEVGYEKTVLSYNDRINNLETQLEIARGNFENAKKSREVTLRSLNNGISESNIAYSSAAKEYSKLTISSPISGTVGKVLVDEGQEVGAGTQVFSVSNNQTPEISFSFSKTERELVKVGQEVLLTVGNDTFTGTLDSISEIADENLKYKSTTSFDSDLKLIGEIVRIEIPIMAKYPLIPINSIIKQSLSIEGSEDLGKVYFLEDTEPKTMNVILGDIYYDRVEVLGCIIDGMDSPCNDKKIILSDMSQFDANKFKLIENEK